MSDNLIMSVKGDLVRAFNQAITPYRRVPVTMANPFRLPLQQLKPREAAVLTPEEITSEGLSDLSNRGGSVASWLVPRLTPRLVYLAKRRTFWN